MSIAVYVIDTSYLLELFKVPNHSNPSSITEINQRFDNAIQNKSRLFVPLPCIFEFAKHIAGVIDGSVRNRTARYFCETVKTSVEKGGPWIIIPSISIEELPQFCDIYIKQYVSQKFSLTDTFIITEARRIKKEYGSLDYNVHIWTKDTSLKAHEPDTEENPFLG